MITVKDRIKKLRKALDLTQQAFADRLGIRQNTIAKYETGRGNPTTAVISLICREFNVDEGWLRTGEGEMFKSTTSDALDALIEQYGVSKDARAMIKSFLDLKPEQQEAVVAYVKKVAAALNEEDPASPSLSLLPPIDPQSKPEAVEPEPDYKAEARAEAEKYYQMLLLEKRMESQGPSASEFGAG